MSIVVKNIWIIDFKLLSLVQLIISIMNNKFILPVLIFTAMLFASCAKRVAPPYSTVEKS